MPAPSNRPDPGANNGQAIDFADLVSTSGTIHLTNEATGLIKAADADAIRGGVNMVIDNFGRILGGKPPANRQ